MATATTKRFVVTTIGVNAVTLTPYIGEGTGGVKVSGTLPVTDPDVAGGLSSVIFNFTGTPDTTLFPKTNLIVTLDIESDGPR